MQIIYDEYEVAREHFLPLDADHEILHCEWDWLKWLRAKVENPGLFVYRHRLTGRYMLCDWIHPPSGHTTPICQELEGFDGFEEGCDWPSGLLSPQVLLARLTPTPDIVEKQKRRLRDQDNARRSELEHKAEIRKDSAKRLRSVGLEREARKMESGGVPIGVPSDATREMARELARM
jgi:hypothetical protein